MITKKLADRDYVEQRFLKPEDLSDALLTAKNSGVFDGRGIQSIVRTAGTGAAGTADTYTITFSDNSTSSYIVYNGKDGSDGSTPVKGTDYFTVADKKELLAALKSMLTFETWTFTLEDGSTVTKAVLLE